MKVLILALGLVLLWLAVTGRASKMLRAAVG